MSRGAQTPRASETITSRTVLPASDGGNAQLDRVRKVDELPLEGELIGQACRERLDPDSLRRVVAGCDEVDTQFARRVEAGLCRLAGQEQVVTLACGVRQVAGRPAGDDRRAFDSVRTVREHDRLATQSLANPGGELVRGDRLRQRAAEADPGEGLRG